MVWVTGNKRTDPSSSSRVGPAKQTHYRSTPNQSISVPSVPDPWEESSTKSKEGELYQIQVGETKPDPRRQTKVNQSFLLHWVTDSRKRNRTRSKADPKRRTNTRSKEGNQYRKNGGKLGHIQGKGEGTRFKEAQQHKIQGTLLITHPGWSLPFFFFSLLNPNLSILVMFINMFRMKQALDSRVMLAGLSSSLTEMFRWAQKLCWPGRWRKRWNEQ